MPSPSPAAKRLGDRIKQLRVDRDLSREYVAEHTGRELSTIQRAESGSTDIRVSTLVLIADALGTNVAKLLEGIGPELYPRSEPRSTNRKRIDAARRARRESS